MQSKFEVMPTDPYLKAEVLFATFLRTFFTEEELDDDHLVDTPKRVVRAWQEFFGAAHAEFEATTFENTTGIDQMIIVSDIPVYSMCAHHFLPFFGKAHVAYIPTDKLLGLSKFARVVGKYAHKPQVQERLTHQIAHELENILNPRGVGVVLQCEHLCMSMRGVEKPGHCTTTSTLLGVFLEPSNLARTEFLSLVNRSRV